MDNMQEITILDKDYLDATQYTLARCQGVPQGYLYNITESLNIFKLLKSFAIEYQDIYKQIEKNINGFYIVDENSIWLDELMTTYGLPNVIFPDITTAKEKALAINIMRYLKTLNSIESYQAFLLLLGYSVKIYSINETLEGNISFNYNLPIFFSNSTSTKDKLTYFVYVETDSQNLEEFYNIGDAFPLDFVLPDNDFYIVKKILDFIKPDYIIFEYITETEKTLFGIT